MVKRIFILIAFALSVSTAFTAETSTAKEQASVRAAAVPTYSDTTGIKNELGNESLKKILASLLEIKEGKIGEIINKFSTDTSDYKWIIREGRLPKDVNGTTEPTSDGAVTTLDLNKLRNATNLSVARTMIHEMVHAYLTLYYRFDFMQAKVEYPGIYLAWQSEKKFDYGKVQHEEIEKMFLNEIADALKLYGENNDLNVNDNVYEDLAWGGLDFQNSKQLTSSARRRIQDRLLAEMLNKKVGSESPVGIQII